MARMNDRSGMNKGKSRDVISTGSWEPIPREELPAVGKVEVNVIGSDLASALAKAQKDAEKEFGKR
jgi:hypothetical protein